MDTTALWVTVKLATVTTVVLGLVGIPLAWWLCRMQSRARIFVEAALALPLVLPPTVLGFYALWMMGPNHVVGRAFETLLGEPLPFSFAGLVLASIVYNVPFALRPFTAAFSAVDPRCVETSLALGVRPWPTFFRVVLPLAKGGVVTGLILTFAHAVGEFGVVMMVGGNVEGVTRTLSVSIYDDVAALDYSRAGQTAAVMLVFSYAVLLAAEKLGARRSMM